MAYIQRDGRDVYINDEEVSEIVEEWIKNNKESKEVIFRKLEYVFLCEEAKYLPEIMQALSVGQTHPKFGNDLIQVLGIDARKYLATIKADDLITEQLANSSPKETLYKYFRQD